MHSTLAQISKCVSYITYAQFSKHTSRWICEQLKRTGNAAFDDKLHSCVTATA